MTTKETWREPETITERLKRFNDTPTAASEGEPNAVEEAGKPKCPQCGQHDTRLFKSNNGSRYVHCNNCQRVTFNGATDTVATEGEHCDACKGVGWLLTNNDVHGLRIERCDTCEKFESDDKAVKAVVNSHERLVSALELCKSFLSSSVKSGQEGDYELLQVRMALALATGE
jgi:hypothetical protein